MTDARTLERPASHRDSLVGRLREATAEAHGRLEQGLDLLGRVNDRQRFAHVLDRFLGFHLTWERAIRRRPDLGSFLEPRSRLPHLRRDLSALGRTNAEVARLPACAAAVGLAQDEAAAVGSIYVMEGSTLGGQVIGRALAGVGWRPAGGLTYFDPYGERTGAMWRAFGSWAETRVSPTQRPAAEQGARRTFAVLQEWLTS